MKKTKGHQGDVIFASIETIPSGAVEVENSPIALGERHGHCHALTGNVKKYSLGDRVFFAVLGTHAVLQHTNIANMNKDTYKAENTLPVEDHQPIILPKGNYEFWIQNEYNPYRKLMEKTQD
jgi:hypothetical protein